MTSPTFKVVQDILPIPENIGAFNDPDKRPGTATSLDDGPTVSHALAVGDHDEKGHAQQVHEHEVKDLGWNEPDEEIANPLVGGLHNEELWVLIRRFNKQMYHVKEYTRPAPGNLDLNISDDEEFSPDKLRANLERFYMTIGIGSMAFVKHIARLRSWREKRRTAAFCAAYFLASLLDLLVPLILLTMIVLILYPPSRDILFPPAPLALVSSSHGGLQKPQAGVLGSVDSATGAPENHKGEAVEAEASNFVNSIAAVALSSASGKHPQNDPPATADNNFAPDSRIPDPTAIAVSASNARVTAAGQKKDVQTDKTKVPMETAMWTKMRPLMHGVADAADTWERFGNALCPTPPFASEVYRLRLAAVVVPLLAASIFITSYMLVKSITLGIGFGFFGDPVITPGLRWLNTNFPHWQKLLELRNTLLKGVPTNAQLTITLLRLGEANRAPLPPPPYAEHPPPDEPVDITDEHMRATGADYPLNATDEEIKDAMAADTSVPHREIPSDIAASKEKSHGHKGHRLLSALKGTVRGTVTTALGADQLKARAGSVQSKHRLGVLPSSREEQLSGPVDFKCRYNGKRGHAYISTKATSPCISFALDKVAKKALAQDRGEDELNPIWSIAIADIRELKKVGGLGWKAKLVVGWALNREVADGLEIVDKQGGHWLLTAMVLRDELFNRLIAMGGQKWEAW